MVNYLILLGILMAVPAQSVTVKLYQKRGGGSNNLLLTAFIGLFAMAVFALPAILQNGFAFSPSYLIYSLGFAIGYGMAFVFQILALSCGPMSLTVLIQSYSLLIPTFYGVIFLEESVKWGFVPGIVLLAVCLFLINYRKRAGGAGAPGEGRITLKWLVFVWLSFLGNGMCSTVQKAATVHLDEAYHFEFMVVAMLLITLGFLIAGLIRERHHLRDFLRRGWYFGGICGLLNGGANLAVLLLAARMPASIQYPLISAGSILFSLLFSVTIFKEKITRQQYAGIAIGVLSIVFLNL